MQDSMNTLDLCLYALTLVKPTAQSNTYWYAGGRSPGNRLTVMMRRCMRPCMPTSPMQGHGQSLREQWPHFNSCGRQVTLSNTLRTACCCLDTTTLHVKECAFEKPGLAPSA